MDLDFDLICIGDAVIDAFLKIHDENTHLRLDKEKNELCVRFGEKIQLDNYEFLLGGDACNVSVGASRSGLKTAFCAELGDDEFSQKIIDGLLREKVDLSLVKRTPNQKSSLAIAINFQNERTLFVRHVEREHNLVLGRAQTKWVYLTSLGREWKKAYANALSFVQNNNLKLAFNPGTPQIEKGVESYIEAIRQSEILFVNKTEAIEIVNSPSVDGQIVNSNEDENIIKQLLKHLQSLGAKIVVVTNGKDGSWAIDKSGKTYKTGIVECEVVQKTGAGDAYTSGFLAAIILGFSIEEAMRWGTINSTSVIQKIGAQSGLLTRTEIEKLSEENKGL